MINIAYNFEKGGDFVTSKERALRGITAISFSLEPTIHAGPHRRKEKYEITQFRLRREVGEAKRAGATTQEIRSSVLWGRLKYHHRPSPLSELLKRTA